MKTPPILVIKKGSATASDISAVRKLGICVLVVNDPSSVRYMDPPLESVSGIERLCFKLVNNAIKKDASLYANVARQEIVDFVMSQADVRAIDRLPNVKSTERADSGIGGDKGIPTDGNQ